MTLWSFLSAFARSQRGTEHSVMFLLVVLFFPQKGPGPGPGFGSCDGPQFLEEPGSYQTRSSGRNINTQTRVCVCVWLMFTQTFVSICTELHHRVSGTFLHLNRPRSFLEGSSFRLTVPVTPRDKHFNSSGNLVPVTKKKVGFHAGDRVWGPEQ